MKVSLLQKCKKESTTKAAKTHSRAAEAAAEEALTAAAEAELKRIDSESDEEWEAALQTTMDYTQAKLKKVLEKTLLLMFWACGSAPVYSHVSACCELPPVPLKGCPTGAYRFES